MWIQKKLNEWINIVLVVVVVVGVVAAVEESWL